MSFPSIVCVFVEKREINVRESIDIQFVCILKKRNNCTVRSGAASSFAPAERLLNLPLQRTGEYTGLP